MAFLAAGSRLQRLNAAVKKRSAGAQILLSEHMQALWHAYKPLTRPERGLLERYHPSLLMQARCMGKLHEKAVVRSMAEWEHSSSQYGSHIEPSSMTLSAFADC